MNLTVEIPDDLVGRLTAAGGDLSRRALEALALEEFRSGHITKAELRRLLGFGTRYELDGFLKAHAVWIDYTVEDFQRELQDLKRLGF
jgi:predicted HTH domain antitoxin